MIRLLAGAFSAVALTLLSSATYGQTIKLVAGSSCASSALTTITTPATIPPAGFVQTVSMCVTSGAQPVCGAAYPIDAANTAAAAISMTVAQPVYSAPFTAETASPAFPATIPVNPGVGLGNSVPFAGPQAGGAGVDQKLSQFDLTVPTGVAVGTYNFEILAPSVDSRNALATSCNDFVNLVTSTNLPNIAFSVTVPAGPPAITIARNVASVADNGTAITYTVTATPAQAITVNLTSSVTGTMTGVTNNCGASIAIPAGGSNTCTISATNTVPFDGPGTATVTIAAPTVVGAYTGTGNSATAQITNDDLPTVTLSPATANVNDTGASQTVTVTLSATAPTGGFAVPLTALAANGRYSGTCVGAASLTVLAGATTATCTIVGAPNTVAGDGNVNAVVALNCAATCTNGAQAISTITVVDDDVPVISVTCTPTTLTDAAAQVATCSFSSDKTIGATALAVTINPPVANARYTTTCASPVSIPANTAANTAVAPCTITAVANTALGDGNVTATLSVAAGAGYSVGGSSQSVAVNNDDLATISVAASPASVVENSGTPIVFTFTASAASPTATNILFTPPAVNAARYTTTCVSPIVLPANAMTVTCSVTPVDTAVPDGTATATVTVLASAANYTLGLPAAITASGTITDDEVGVSVTATGATEGSNVSFSITCTGPAASTATVTFAISGQDAGAVITPAPGPVSVNCGTPTPVTVSTTNDAIQGNSRSVGITLSNPVAPAVLVGAGTASASVLDNDAPLVVPTMSVFGLGFMSLMLAGFVAFQRRRVQK